MNKSPYGVWDYTQLIGSTVKIKSLSISSGCFGYDSDQLHSIENISIRLNRYGKAYTSIKLVGINREFVWKDLEIIGLQFWLWNPAICGIPCCGRTICGYNCDIVDNSNNEDEEIETSTTCNCEGGVLDG